MIIEERRFCNLDLMGAFSVEFMSIRAWAFGNGFDGRWQPVQRYHMRRATTQTGIKAKLFKPLLKSHEPSIPTFTN